MEMSIRAKEILDKLLTIGFLTGSRAFGTETEHSDYDIVYSVQDSLLVSDVIKDNTKTNSEYFSGYYITIEGTRINLIPVHPHAFFPWYLATIAMTSTYKISGIIDPIKKYAIFEGMVALYKGMVNELFTVDYYDILKEAILHNKLTEYNEMVRKANLPY